MSKNGKLQRYITKFSMRVDLNDSAAYGHIRISDLVFFYSLHYDTVLVKLMVQVLGAPKDPLHYLLDCNISP